MLAVGNSMSTLKQNRPTGATHGFVRNHCVLHPALLGPILAMSYGVESD